MVLCCALALVCAGGNVGDRFSRVSPMVAATNNSQSNRSEEGRIGRQTCFQPRENRRQLLTFYFLFVLSVRMDARQHHLFAWRLLTPYNSIVSTTVALAFASTFDRWLYEKTRQ